ncbi:hypothetical protein Isop_0167 [Isosphaera pallida ATCC 43644]|jgi:hypothetical protein|uniref:Uncharacterized protein n=1 Tax=Isosphaera pallida (strain ATCC 43644 / DSM 9630 / IS1B) TaxID=575540 RepID=E8R669_ISOPI|nr:hypothetical protein [Isosphaera pallida]ADV60764.1 hypothetical protein Isop_0167 [Isosphaera pallida ATCC 43644]
MSPDLTKVTVQKPPGSPASVAQHRDFPQIRGEGADPREAVVVLESQLVRTLDTALTTYRRAEIEQALADVRAFMAKN